MQTATRWQHQAQRECQGPPPPRVTSHVYSGSVQRLEPLSGTLWLRRRECMTLPAEVSVIDRSNTVQQPAQPAHRVGADADDARAEGGQADRLTLPQPQRVADRPPPAAEHLRERDQDLLNRPVFVAGLVGGLVSGRRRG